MAFFWSWLNKVTDISHKDWVSLFSYILASFSKLFEQRSIIW